MAGFNVDVNDVEHDMVSDGLAKVTCVAKSEDHNKCTYNGALNSNKRTTFPEMICYNRMCDHTG